MRIALLVAQPDLDGGFPNGCLRFHAELAHRLPHLKRVALVEVEVDVNRQQLIERRELGRAARADKIARVDQTLADAPGERRGNASVTEIDLGQLDLRLGLVP